MANVALLYCHQSEVGEAEEWARAQDGRVLVRSARYHRGEIEQCVLVYLTPRAAHVGPSYERYGVPVEEVRVTEPEGGYEVVQSGTWYKLMGPDGQQVGKSQRSESDAWQELGAE